MTITLDITPEVQAELARQATAQGRALEAVAASLLEKAACVPAGSEPERTPQAVVEACERLKTFGKRHGLSLGGITLRELRYEARP
jgi:hypothetical protein